MGTTADKLTYLGTTKARIKDGINRLGGELTNLSTFRSYATALDNIYNALPKVSGEGSSLSLSPTREGGLSIIPKGACEQDSYSGKNKFDVGTLPTQTQAGVLFTPVYENGLLQYINANGTATSTIFYQLKKITLPAGDYIINGTLGGDLNSCVIGLNFGDGRIYSLGSGQSFTLETQATATESFIRVSNGATLDNVKLYPMIRLASVSDDTYEPYTNGASPNPDYPQDIRVVTGDNEFLVQNKNLFVFNNPINVNLTKGTHRTTTINFKERKLIKAGIYTVSIPDLVVENSNQNYPIGVQLAGNVNFQIDGTTKKGSFTITSDITPASVYIFMKSADNDNATASFTKIQLENGDTDTDYVEGKSQTLPLHLGTEYLAGIDTYKDEIVGKTDDWKIRRYVGKVVLNGSENWKYASNNKNFYIDGTDYLPYNQGGKCYTTHFIGNAIDPNYNQDLHSFIGNTSFITIKYFLYTNVNDFKNWLTTHNVTTYYILLEPVEEIITDTTLITDLNNMYQAMGYDGTTNISITSDTSNAQMTAEVKALKSLE